MKKRILALTLAAILAIGCLTGCGGGKSNSNEAGAEGNTTTDIQISVWNAGLGVEWLDALIKGFNEKYPEYNVYYSSSADIGATVATLGMEDIDSVDLYLTYVSNKTKYLEPLDDVLEATADGDEKTIKEKFLGNYLESAVASDGHYYTLTSGGAVFSFVYNKEMFDDAGITQLPRTTDELVVVCDTLYSAGYTPLCHFINGGYYTYLDQVFMAQYSGMDYCLNNYYGCTDEAGNSPSKDVLTAKDGRYYALKAYEKFITPEYTLVGSNSKTHTEIQTEFLNGKAAMMLNGSWLQNEMKNVEGLEKFGQMRMPVLSDIVNRLSSVKSEKTLRALITAIDQVTDGEKQQSDFASGEDYSIGGQTVSAEDWEIVSEARNTVACNYAGETAFIPNYSEAKEGAKEFLKYLYSDEGLQIYADVVQVPKPISLSTEEKIDTSKYSDFAKFQFQLLHTAEKLADSNINKRHRIFTDGGATDFAGVNYAAKFSTNNIEDRMSADEAWDLVVDTINDNYEAVWLKNIAGGE